MIQTYHSVSAAGLKVKEKHRERVWEICLRTPEVPRDPRTSVSNKTIARTLNRSGRDRPTGALTDSSMLDKLEYGDG